MVARFWATFLRGHQPSQKKQSQIRRNRERSVVTGFSRFVFARSLDAGGIDAKPTAEGARGDTSEWNLLPGRGAIGTSVECACLRYRVDRGGGRGFRSAAQQ